jgi:uncharacterized protein YbjT (DUF2867 family)
MLVIFGANGRTGVEVVKEALRQGIPVRPIVRDDRDGRGLDKVIDVAHVSYADPDHPDSLAAVLQGATQVVSCIDARTAGHGCPTYGDLAGLNIVQAAADAGAQCILHLSMVGAYRWSPNPLNRRGFHVDKHVRQRKDLPWTMLRVSCYADEIIEGHIRPPDGRKPHRILDSSRYTPISRRDVARMVVNHLPELVPGRTLYVGGPETFSGRELRALISPHVQPGSGWRRTGYGALPPGDVAVDPDVTRIMVTTRPKDQLLTAIDPSAAPPPPLEPEPVYARVEPGPHAADEGRDLKVLRALGPDLRRVVHAQLVADLAAMDLPTDGVVLDFRSARSRKKGRTVTVHEGRVTEMTGVVARTPDGEELHRAAMTFVWDKLADEFRAWFEREDGVPHHVWESLDMGVRRRMVEDAAWAEDPRVQGFAGGQETASV